jgi:hypothetical protein
LGSRSVPAVDGNMNGCSPRYGSDRRSVNVVIANAGSGMVRFPAALLVPPILCMPLPATLTTLPLTVSVPVSALKSSQRKPKQFRPTEPRRDHERDRVNRVVIPAVRRGAHLGQQITQLLAGEGRCTFRPVLRPDRLNVAYRVGAQ